MVCRLVLIGFAVLWLLAAFVLVVGTFGRFGETRDPLSGVFLILIGSPWVQMASQAGLASPLLALLAPGLNFLLILWACRRFGRRV